MNRVAFFFCGFIFKSVLLNRLAAKTIVDCGLLQKPKFTAGRLGRGAENLSKLKLRPSAEGRHVLLL
jgi:hypothetical protein